MYFTKCIVKFEVAPLLYCVLADFVPEYVVTITAGIFRSEKHLIGYNIHCPCTMISLMHYARQVSLLMLVLPKLISDACLLKTQPLYSTNVRCEVP